MDCKLNKNLSLQVYIPKEKQIYSLLKERHDPKWNGNWLIYYLYLLDICKKYKHTNSLYLNKNILAMRINLIYSYDTYTQTIDPDIDFNKYIENPRYKAYIDFIINQIYEGTEILIIPLSISIYTDTDSNHENVLIYKRCLNSIEHFEPYGDFYNEKEIGEKIQVFLESLVKLINKECELSIKLVTNSETALNSNINIPYESNYYQPRGPQSLEFWTNEYSDYEKERGYCVAWVLLFIEISLKYTSLSIKQINQSIMGEVIDSIVNTGMNNQLAIHKSKQYLLLARNYCFFIMRQIEFNYYFIFDEFAEGTNNSLITQTHRIYNEKYTYYFFIINIIYEIELEYGYRRYYKELFQEYKDKFYTNPSSEELKTSLLSLNTIKEKNYRKYSLIIRMNLILKLLKNEKQKTKQYITIPINLSKELKKVNFKNTYRSLFKKKIPSYKVGYKRKSKSKKTKKSKKTFMSTKQ